MPWRSAIVLIVLLGILAFIAFRRQDRSSSQAVPQTTAPVVDKQPVKVTMRQFNPSDPPPDMPPLSYGEIAECDTDFGSYASVGGKTRQTDATHGIVTVTQVKVTLQLNVTIWLPDEVTPHVSEHEDGHRQISEHYYSTADQIAQRVAATHMGEEVVISGPDLRAEADKALQQIGAEITEEYGRELNPNAAQLRFDAITDHGRNDVEVNVGIAQALADGAPDSSNAVADPAN